MWGGGCGKGGDGSWLKGKVELVPCMRGKGGDGSWLMGKNCMYNIDFVWME